MIIDAQKEYQDGILRLVGFEAAVKEIRALLDRARALGVPVIHVVHKGKPGGKAFDPNSNKVEIFDTLMPAAGEIVIEKSLPNSLRRRRDSRARESTRAKRKNCARTKAA